MKTKTNMIDRIKSLNLWGNDLDDVSILQRMDSIEVLSLAVNHITTLKDIASCYRLRELYMRRNNVGRITELKYLQGLNQLKILSLAENPVASLPHYRQLVIRLCPSIEKLDDAMVTNQEKEMAE